MLLSCGLPGAIWRVCYLRPGPIRAVKQMVTESERALKAAKPDLTLEELKTQFAAEKDQEIYWSVAEREKFLAGLKEGIHAKDGAAILAALGGEIRAELFEARLKSRAQDFEGSERDYEKNEARDLIQTVFETGGQGLTLAQRQELEAYTLDLVKSAAEDSPTGAEHFAGLKQAEWLDKMVTKAEAGKIAELVQAKAAEIKAGKIEKQQPPLSGETVPRAAGEIPQTRLEQAQRILERGFTPPEWYQPNETVQFDSAVSARITNAENSLKTAQAVADLKVVGIEATDEAFAAALGEILTKRKKAETGVLRFLSSETQQLAQKIEVRAKNVLAHLTQRYGAAAAAVTQELLKFKEIKATDLKEILEYVAFGPLEADLEALADYVKAKNELAAEGAPKIEVNETITVRDTLAAIKQEVTTTEELELGVDKFARAKRAFKNKDYGKAFKLFSEGLLDFKVLWANFILSWAPLLGQFDFAKEWLAEAQATREQAQIRAEKPTLTALAKFFGLEQSNADLNALRGGLQQITLTQLQGLTTPERRTRFLTENTLNLKPMYLERIYTKLFTEGKRVELNAFNSAQNVFTFLQSEIQKQPNYLEI